MQLVAFGKGMVLSLVVLLFHKPIQIAILTKRRETIPPRLLEAADLSEGNMGLKIF